MRKKLAALPLRFRPRLLDALKDYSAQKFMADLGAGVTVGIVALPLAMAFGMASGVTPQAGLVTAIVAGFLISALGGTRFQIGGPTGAFIPILAAIVLQYDHGNAEHPAALLTCTFLAGIMLFLLGISGLGRVIKFIPYPVTMGFTSGIAVIIFAGQLKDFFGLPMERVPPEFVEKLAAYWEHSGRVNYSAAIVGLGAILVMMLWPAKWQRRVPSSLIALVLATFAVRWLGLDVATIGSAFPGGIPAGLPEFQLPQLDFATLQNLLGPAATIAMLGAIESLLSAVVADGLTSDRHDSNQELMAQGIANLAAPLFGGIAATGAIARTGTNIRSGAVTPVAGIVHSLTLLVILLAAAPLANGIPLAALAGILLVVAAKMGEWHEFARLRKLPRSDALVFLTVFALTVLTDLTLAVEAGLALAALLFIKRVSETSGITALDENHPATGERPAWADDSWPEGVFLFRIQGAFFFGTADMLETSLRRAGTGLRVLVLLCEDVFTMDATGLNALESLHERLAKHRQHLIVCRLRPQPLAVLEKSGFLDELGRDNFTASIEDALQRARGLLYDGGEAAPAERTK